MKIGVKAKKTLEIILPISFNIVELKKPITEKSARGTLEKYDGKLVMIKDVHNSVDSIQYRLGKLTIDKEDKECYSFHFINQENSQRLWYNDLEGLIVPSNEAQLRAKLYKN